MKIKSAVLQINILSYWHAGSGDGRGAELDALVLKSGEQLPYIPGRTVKGLLREGVTICEENGLLVKGRTDTLFGQPAGIGVREASTPGSLVFDNASLPTEEARWLAANHTPRNALYDHFSSTSIDEYGMAVDHTLRTIELCVPLCLYATVQGPGTDWLPDLKIGCTMVRALGSHRNRGLGRCEIQFIKEGETHHA